MEQTQALHCLLGRKMSTRRRAAIITHRAHAPEIQQKRFAEVKGKLKGFEPDMKDYQG